MLGQRPIGSMATGSSQLVQYILQAAPLSYSAPISPAALNFGYTAYANALAVTIYTRTVTFNRTYGCIFKVDFALTASASLMYARILDAASLSYGFTIKDAVLAFDYPVSLNPISFAVTPKFVGTYDRVALSAALALKVKPTPSKLAFNRVLVGNAGSVQTSFGAAALSYGLTFNIAPPKITARVTLSKLALGRVLLAASPAVNLTLDAATLSHGYRLNAYFAHFEVVGGPATLGRNRAATVNAPSVTVRVRSSTLAIARVMAAQRAALLETVTPAGFAYNRVLKVNAPSFGMSLKPATFKMAFAPFATAAAEAALSLQPALLAYNRVAVCQPMVVEVIALPVTFIYSGDVPAGPDGDASQFEIITSDYPTGVAIPSETDGAA